MAHATTGQPPSEPGRPDLPDGTETTDTAERLAKRDGGDGSGDGDTRAVTDEAHPTVDR